MAVVVSEYCAVPRPRPHLSPSPQELPLKGSCLTQGYIPHAASEGYKRPIRLAPAGVSEGPSPRQSASGNWLVPPAAVSQLSYPPPHPAPLTTYRSRPQSTSVHIHPLSHLGWKCQALKRFSALETYEFTSL